MRGETQAAHLEKMMQKHPYCVYYDVAFPAVVLKRTARKKLKEGDIVLMRIRTPQLQLYKENVCMANVKMQPSLKSVVVEVLHETKTHYGTHDSKKYDVLLCSFGKVHSKEIEKGMVLNVSELDFTSLKLFTEGKELAMGRPVWVDGEVAVEITKVKR